MECLKCGRETVGSEVFCNECLKDMEKHPVPDNTPVLIHSRKDTPRKAPSIKIKKNEETISQMKKEIHQLRLWVAILAVLFIISLGALGYTLWGAENDPDLGSNYSSMTDDSGTELN